MAAPRAAAAAALAVALRLGVGGLFLVAGALKLRDAAGFAQEIANYQLLPSLAPYLAIVLPPIEMVAALALVLTPSPSWRRAAAVTIAGLLALFTIAVVAAVARGVDISCGCFGTGSARVSGWTVARNVALLAAASAIVWWEGRAPTSGPRA